MLSLPPLGELLNTCAVRRPRRLERREVLVAVQHRAAWS